MEVYLCFSWRYIPYMLQQAAIVEPVDPFKRGLFDSFKAAPGATPVNDFSFEETVDCFGQSIVIGIPNAAD